MGNFSGAPAAVRSTVSAGRTNGTISPPPGWGRESGFSELLGMGGFIKSGCVWRSALGAGEFGADFVEGLGALGPGLAQAREFLVNVFEHGGCDRFAVLQISQAGSVRLARAWQGQNGRICPERGREMEGRSHGAALPSGSS